jgi:dihydrofolate reductase
MSVPFDLVLGRRTYVIFAAYWPNAAEEAGGKPLNDATKYVASRGRPTLGWGRRSCWRATSPTRSPG